MSTLPQPGAIYLVSDKKKKFYAKYIRKQEDISHLLLQYLAGQNKWVQTKLDDPFENIIFHSTQLPKGIPEPTDYNTISKAGYNKISRGGRRKSTRKKYFRRKK
jgi:hypothetical protein